jgi:hypothetical protein
VRAFGQTCARAIRTRRFPQDAKQENVQLKDENAMLRRLVGGPRYRDSKTAGDRGLSANSQRRAFPQTAKSGCAGEVALLRGRFAEKRRRLRSTFWENAKGESVDSPGVTRNWTAIRRSPPEERKKADQQNRIPSPPLSVLAKMRPPNKIRKRPALHLTVSSSHTFGQPPHNSGRITGHSYGSCLVSADSTGLPKALYELPLARSARTLF